LRRRGGGRRRGGTELPRQTPEALKESFEVLLANTNCWRTGQKVLRGTSAHAVLMQEHKLVTKDEIEEASAWAIKAGWKSFFEMGILTQKGGRSAGTAIFIKKELGAMEARYKIEEKVEGRFVACAVQVPGLPTFHLASHYFETGSGLGEVNLKLLGIIGLLEAKGGLPLLAGGDFNLPPAEIMATSFLSRARALLLKTGRATYVSDNSQSVLDYAICSKGLAQAVTKVSVDGTADISPHRG